MNKEIRTSDKPNPAPEADAIFSNGGSIWLLHPKTQAALDWMSEHCPADGEHQYFGSALVVEPRYVPDIVLRAREDGLIIK